MIKIITDLKPSEDCPLPWTVSTRGMFGGQVLSAKQPGVAGQVIVAQGPKETMDFIAALANATINQ